MGYTTEFQGKFKLNKELDNVTYELLKALATTRRMKRNVDNSIFGVEGEFYINGTGSFGQGRDENIIDNNTPPKTQPSLWLQWIPTEDRLYIEWDGNKKFYHADEWIIYLIDRVLAPRGYVLNGVVYAQGEDSCDVWEIHIDDNVVEVL